MEDKPLKEWTIEELATYCDEHEDCVDCIFNGYKHTNRCLFDCETPNKWNIVFPWKSTFTQEEKDMAILLKKLFPEHYLITRDGVCDLYINDNVATEIGTIDIDYRCFPSVGVGEEYALDEIINSEGEKNETD
jgi:hypothetical protein